MLALGASIKTNIMFLFKTIIMLRSTITIKPLWINIKICIDLLMGYFFEKKINKQSTVKECKPSFVETANSVDLDEVAHYEPPHLDLHCLPSSLNFENHIPWKKHCTAHKCWFIRPFGFSAL